MCRTPAEVADHVLSLCTHGSDDGEPCWLPEDHDGGHDFTEPSRPEPICCDYKWTAMTQAARDAVLSLLPTPPAPGGEDTDLRAEVERLLERVAASKDETLSRGWVAGSLRAVLAARGDADQGARCSCGNRFDGDNLCMVSACQWEGIKDEHRGDADRGAGEALAEVRALHGKSFADTSDEAWDRNPVCSHSGHAWPCATYRAALARDTAEAGEGP
jgi:hypothetical protein